MNVSSVVVKSLPEHMEALVRSLEESDLCEVHFTDKSGKIVVTIEAESIDEEMLKVRDIQDMHNVLSAEMIYAYSEDELAKAKEYFITREDAVPDALKEDTD